MSHTLLIVALQTAVLFILLYHISMNAEDNDLSSKEVLYVCGMICAIAAIIMFICHGVASLILS